MRAAGDPIRAELFSAEHLEQFAATLAAEQAVHLRQEARPTAAAAAERKRESARPGTADDRRGQPKGPRRLAGGRVAARQLPHRRRAAPRDPARTCRPGSTGSCPSSPPDRSRAIPRVYGLAWAFVAHTDSRFELETLRRFVRAYQRVQPLTIGELWALAISLRARPRREPPAPRRARRRARDRAGARRRDRRRAASARAAPEPEAAGADPDARGGAVHDGVRGPARPEAARAGPRGHPRARLARPAARRARARQPRGRPPTSTRPRSPRMRRCATSSRACG